MVDFELEITCDMGDRPLEPLSLVPATSFRYRIPRYAGWQDRLH